MKRSTILFLVFLLLSFGLTTHPLLANNRVALVIGNGNYRNAPLMNPVNDAKDISVVLKNLGFDVIIKTDATKKEMVRAINLFAEKIKAADIGLFYFAGHGMQISGANYLLPVAVDVVSESDVEFEAVNASRVIGKMRSGYCKLNVVILDACRNNPFSRTFRSASQGLGRMDAPIGTIISYATGPGAVAADGTGRNGIFTKHLIRAMRQPGLDIQDIFNEAGLGVMQETGNKQVPWTSNTPIPRYYLATSKQEKTPAVAVVAPLKQQETPVVEVVAPLIQQETPTVTVVTPLKKEAYPVVAVATPIIRKEIPAVAYVTPIPLIVATSVKRTIDVSRSSVQNAQSSPREYTDPATGMKFVFVPAGCFQMGTRLSNGSGNERPLHEVCVDAFFLGKYEVTQGEYKKIMGRNPAKFKKGERFPVESVSWKDTQKFASKLSHKGEREYRLPTEAEWEYAARSGGKTHMYSGGNKPDNVAWHRGNSGKATHNVGSKSSNGFGVFDMSGNVYEWCSDWYGADYYKNSPKNNPVGPESASSRVSRGGSWNDGSKHTRSGYRRKGVSWKRYATHGFRLVLKPKSDELFQSEVTFNDIEMAVTPQPEKKQEKDLYASAATQPAIAPIPEEPTLKSTQSAQSDYIDPTTGVEFIRVAGGCFEMGDVFGDGEEDEQPVHEVCLDDFYLGKYEVTQGEYLKVLSDNPSGFKKGDRYPVENVRWKDAEAFIKALNAKSTKKYRFPTEAEWEYAARSGGEKEKYSGSSQLRRVAWYSDNSGKSTHVVGRKSSNGLGFHDMSGNVWEWCNDWMSGDYYDRSTRRNPKGPYFGSGHALRGGGWKNKAPALRLANRSVLQPWFSVPDIGFRLAFTPSK